MTPWNTWDGEDDAELVSRVLNYLNSRLPEGYYALAQAYIIIDAEDGKSQWYQHVTEDDVKEITKGMKPLIIHPDILVLKIMDIRGEMRPHGMDRIVCAVELDGSIHDTRRGRKKDVKRSVKYETGGIHRVVINQADYAALHKEPQEGAWAGVEHHIHSA